MARKQVGVAPSDPSDTVTKTFADSRDKNGYPPATLTDAATVATDASLSNYFRVTITASRTLGVPTNPVDGMRALWEVTASGAGPWTVTLTTGSAGAFKFGTDITSIPAVVTATTTFIGAVYRSASSRWHVLAVSSGH